MGFKAVLIGAIGLLIVATERSEALHVDILDSSRADFSIKCNSCVGILADGSLDSSFATGSWIGRANEANIASYLSGIGISSTTSDVTKFDFGTGGLGGSGNNKNFSFNVSEGVFFVKYGRNTAFFKSYGDDTVSFVKNGRGAGSLSNYGTIAPVPLPATLLLLVGAMASLFAIKRLRPVTA